MKRKNKILCWILLILILLLYLMINYGEYKKEEALIETFFIEEKTIKKEENSNIKEESTKKEEKSYYIGVLEIPSINFKKGFLNINHQDNTVNKNIQVLENSTMPDVDNHLLVIAAHSGNSKRSYFKKLYLLKNDDLIYIYYKGYQYTYQVHKLENQEKNGNITVYPPQEATLILTTCNQEDKTKQIVIYAKLIAKKITT